MWTYLFDGPYKSLDEFRASLEAKARSTDPLFFAVIDNASGQAVGYQTFLRIDPPNRVIEVGNIMYTPAMQRTAGGTEAQYLFARHVFDDLGYRRYEWKCNAHNAPSRRAQPLTNSASHSANACGLCATGWPCAGGCGGSRSKWPRSH